MTLPKFSIHKHGLFLFLFCMAMWGLGRIWYWSRPADEQALATSSSCARSVLLERRGDRVVTLEDVSQAEKVCTLDHAARASEQAQGAQAAEQRRVLADGTGASAVVQE